MNENQLRLPSGKIITFNEEQFDGLKKIKHWLKNGETFFTLAGYAGTGKSTVVKKVLDTYRYGIVVSAPTHKAKKVVINTTGEEGQTLHALLGLRPDVDLDNFNPNNPKFNPIATPRIADYNFVVIDEASMIGHNMGNLLNMIAGLHDKILILVGDWAQAKPVKDGWPLRSDLFERIPTIKLEKNHRQDQDGYLRVLNHARKGVITQEDADTLAPCVSRVPPDDDRYIRMYATNALVGDYNNQRIERHCREENQVPVSLKSTVYDMRNSEKKMKSPLTQGRVDNIITNSRLSCNDTFALGCRVMITQNSPYRAKDRYVNGDAGILDDIIFKSGRTMFEMGPESDFSKEQIDYLTIKLDREDYVDVPIHEANQKNALGETEFTVYGFPVALGWAATIHKCQGTTVDRAWVDMQSIERMPEQGRHGLAYVAISRVRTLEGLKLNGVNPHLFKCDTEIAHLV